MTTTGKPALPPTPTTPRTPAGALRIARAELDGVPLIVLSVPHALPEQLAAALTVAEREVASALALGEPYESIARRRGTRERTIAKQVRTLFRKLGVSSRSELVRLVNTRG